VKENYDLKFTVSQDPLLGFGFGKAFFQPQLLPDLTVGDPAFGGNPFRYVPHNTIYWIWMRLGYPGFFALWYLFGVVVIRGCLIARRLRDPYLQLVAIYIVAITFIEVFVAYSDYQLFTFRTVIYFGMLMGILLRLPMLDRQKGVSGHHVALGGDDGSS
jgi:O-antigen ligase